MTEAQKRIIDCKDNEGLRNTISLLMTSKYTKKDKLIAYCEQRLDRLNTATAFVEQCDLSDMTAHRSSED